MDELLGTPYLDIPIALQVSLGAGYIAYRIAYVGLNRNHTARDSIFMSLIFSSVALITFRLGLPVLDSLLNYLWKSNYRGYYNIASFFGLVFLFVSSVGLTIFAGIYWRANGKKLWQKAMSKHNIREDAVPSAWDEIAQNENAFSQMVVHTKDGRSLYLTDRRNYEQSPHAPYDGIYIGTDGSVIFAVDLVEKDGELEIEHDGIIDETFGTRMTYIPANEIKRIDIRMKPERV